MERVGRGWTRNESFHPIDARPEIVDSAALGLGHATLKGQKDQVSAAANAEFIEQVGDVKFDGAFGNIEFAGDFLVGENAGGMQVELSG